MYLNGSCTDRTPQATMYRSSAKWLSAIPPTKGDRRAFVLLYPLYKMFCPLSAGLGDAIGTSGENRAQKKETTPHAYELYVYNMHITLSS